MPDNPGVYTFRDRMKRPLYIGRATSLRDRVRSYFGIDLMETRGPRIVDMVTKAQGLTWQETESVLEAILLESALIKKYRPFYNIDELDDKSAQYVVITDEAWPRVFLVRVRDLEQTLKDGTTAFKIKKCFGPFTEGGVIKESLKILRRLFPFRDKKANDPRHESFYRAIGQSPEVEGGKHRHVISSSEGQSRKDMSVLADNANDARKNYLKTIRYLSMFFEGKSRSVRLLIQREMKKQAKAMNFEEAAQSRKLLYALEHINDIALLKRERGINQYGTNGKYFRIEAYDIAHLSGTNVVGSMTVSVNGQATNSEYRKFKISKQVNNDVAGLQEVLNRRLNHTEWTYPDLIVVDGNKVQLNAALDVLKARSIRIPIVAVTKDERHKASEIIGDMESIRRHKDEIIAVNAEAHRFAIAFHRMRRARHY